jgi:hypothetical protein
LRFLHLFIPKSSKIIKKLAVPKSIFPQNQSKKALNSAVLQLFTSQINHSRLNQEKD